MKRFWFALVASLTLALVIEAEAQLATRSITVIPTPSGSLDLRYLNGDDGGSSPPTTPQLGFPIVINDDEADIIRATACTGGTAPLVYELQSSITGESTGFTVFVSPAVFDTDGILRVTGLVASTQYWIRLACVDNIGRRSGNSTVQTFTTPPNVGGDVIAPTVATSLNCTSTVAQQIACSWTASTDAVGVTSYTVVRGLGDGIGNPVGSGSVIATLTGTPPVTTYTDTGLTPSQEYYHRINAFDAAGNASGPTARDFTTVISTPPPTSLLFNDDFESATWYTALGWGSGNSATGSPTQGNGTGSDGIANMLRVCTTSHGVTPRDGCMLEVRIKQASNYGTGAGIYSSELGVDPNPGEGLYSRYWVSFGNTWAPNVNGKLPGLSALSTGCGSGNNPCDGSNGWSMRLIYQNPCTGSTSTRQGLATYSYYGNMPDPDAHSRGWSGGYSSCATAMVESTWYCVEQYVQMDTLAADNGIVRQRVNGVQVLELTGLKLDDTSNYSIGKLWFNIYHGGGLGVAIAPQDLHIYFDDVAVDDAGWIGCD